MSAGRLMILLATVGAGSLVAAASGAGAVSTDAAYSPQIRSEIDDSWCEENRSAGTVTYVSPFGYHASPGILDVFVAERLGYFDEMCLDVDIVGASQNSAALVSAGRAQVTTVNTAASVLEQAANGANLVGVATYADASIYTLITLPDITELAQLEGRSFGYHFAVPTIFPEMFRIAGVDTSRVEFINVPSFDPRVLAQGQVDSITAYKSNEPQVLSDIGFEFNQFDPEDFGIEATFNIEVMNQEFLAENRQAATAFMRAVLHAFEYCVANAAECIEILEDYAAQAGAQFDVAHQTRVWEFESTLVVENTLEGAGVGVQTREEWQPEVEALANSEVVDEVPDLTEVQDERLVADLYDGTQLVWP